MTTTNEPEVLAKQIWQEMEKKDALIQKGEIFNLADMEHQVKEFCNLLGTLPPQDARRFEGDLKAIMDKLVNWSVLLEQRKREILQGARSLNAQSKAQTAYMTSSSYNKPNNNA